MDEDGAVTIRESIAKYSSSGKELGRIVCYDKERDGERPQQTDECVFGIHIKDGYVYYTIYTNGRLNLMRGKIGGESECLSTCSFHDSRNLRWCVESGEGGYITCWSNSDVGHVSEDGIYMQMKSMPMMERT